MTWVEDKVRQDRLKSKSEERKRKRETESAEKKHRAFEVYILPYIQKLEALAVKANLEIAKANPAIQIKLKVVDIRIVLYTDQTSEKFVITISENGKNVILELGMDPDHLGLNREWGELRGVFLGRLTSDHIVTMAGILSKQVKTKSFHFHYDVSGLSVKLYLADNFGDLVSGWRNFFYVIQYFSAKIGCFFKGCGG